MVVIAEAGVVVALGVRRRGGGTALLHDVVVLLAVKGAAVAQRELVPWDQLARARRTPEALYVVDFTLRPHHEVRFAERRAALVTLRPEQPEREMQKHISKCSIPVKLLFLWY